MALLTLHTMVEEVWCTSIGHSNLFSSERQPICRTC